MDGIVLQRILQIDLLSFSLGCLIGMRIATCIVDVLRNDMLFRLTTVSKLCLTIMWFYKMRRVVAKLRLTKSRDTTYNC